MRQKKSLLDVAFALFGLLYIPLPSYFAFEINTVFPLITASRIVLFLLFIAYVVSNEGKICLKFLYDKRIKAYFTVFFLFASIPNLFFLFETSEAIKQLLLLYIEGLFLLWLLCQLLDRRKAIEALLEYMAWGSFIIAVFSIIGSVIGVNFFEYLNTVSRKVAIANFSRLGFLRAEAGFGHAVHYGLYSTVIMTIVLYLYETKRKARWLYLVILLTDLIAFLFANSRGSMLAFGVVIIVRLWDERKNWFSFVRAHLWIFVSLLVGAITAFLAVPKLWLLFYNIMGSLINAFLPGAVDIGDYGTNINGFHSRTFQISGVYWVLTHSPIIGMGPKADGRGLIKYLNDYGGWYVTDTYDVGYFSLICNFGIVGALGYLALLMVILKMIRQVLKVREPMGQMLKYAFLAYFLCYLSSVGVDKLLWVLLGILVSYYNILLKEKN